MGKQLVHGATPPLAIKQLKVSNVILYVLVSIHMHHARRSFSVRWLLQSSYAFPAISRNNLSKLFKRRNHKLSPSTPLPFITPQDVKTPRWIMATWGVPHLAYNSISSSWWPISIDDMHRAHIEVTRKLEVMERHFYGNSQDTKGCHRRNHVHSPLAWLYRINVILVRVPRA